jgi:LPXTG-motif cell wall-anchored protein
VATTSTTQVSSVTVAGVTATTAAPNRLPLTGSGGGWPPLVGATALGLGGALSLVSRRRRGSRA